MQRKRTQGRELALQLLYQIDLLTTLPAADRERFLGEHAEGLEQRAFAESLVLDVAKHQASIDVEIEEVAKNWEIGRMAIIDRNILRMGILEICYRSAEVPHKVAINEAVDLAKKYSTKNSSAFVNGILDRVRERFEEAKRAPGQGPAGKAVAEARAKKKQALPAASGSEATLATPGEPLPPEAQDADMDAREGAPARP